MNALSQVSTRDLELLSAYLDGELGEPESARLAARIEQDPALRAALQQLGAAAELLGTLPALKPPRSYALSREQAGSRPAPAGFPTLQLATALATLAFFVVLGADLVTSSLMRAAQAPQAELAAREMPAQPPEEPAAAPTGTIAALQTQALPESAILGEAAAEGAQATIVVEQPAEESLPAAAEAEQPVEEAADFVQEAELQPEEAELTAEAELRAAASQPGTPEPGGEQLAPAGTSLAQAEQAPPAQADKVEAPLAQEAQQPESQLATPSEAEARPALATGLARFFRLAEVALALAAMTLAALLLRSRRGRRA